MKTLREHWSGFYQEHRPALETLYPGLSPERFLREVGDVLGRSLSDAEVSFSRVQLRELSGNLLNGVPFQYLLGEAEFYHHRFFVSPDVLIPRPETEFLVDEIARTGRRFARILDVGTGSGVILLSLLKAGIGEKGEGVDISGKALRIAGINSRRLRLTERAKFSLSDRFGNVQGQFDLVVSNPPYIRARSHRKGVHDSVDAHEPHEALYLDDADYDSWFQAFFSEIEKHLSPGGEFWMEGHELELRNQAPMLEAAGLRNVQIRKDLSGTERFLCGRI